MQNKLILKNYHINVLGRWLNTLSLIGRDSRSRTQFVKMLVPVSETIEAARLSILEKYAEKDEAGEMKKIPVLNDDGTPKIGLDGKPAEKFDMSPDKEVSFKKDWADYLAEDCVIDILPSNEKVILNIHNIVLNTDQVIKDEYVKNEAGEVTEVIAWTNLYSEWCDALDKAVE